MVVNMSLPLWRPASTRNSRFVVWACRESLCVTHETLWCVYRYLLWCLRHLFSGEKPFEGYLGGCLPANLKRTASSGNQSSLCQNGTKFALVEIRGDWAWHCFSLQLKPRWQSEHCCFKCFANSWERLDFSLRPVWLTKQFSHQDFMNLALKGREPCRLVAHTVACIHKHAFLEGFSRS